MARGRAAAAVVVALLLAGCGTGTTTSGGSSSGAAKASTSAKASSSAPKPSGRTGASSNASSSAAPSNPSTLATIRESELPAEGKKTLQLIRQGGPFPYSRDGIHFGNYEKALPAKSGSYYKEYTVKTPGDSTRGPQRIIVGQGSEKYFTADHYATFKFIQEGQ